VPPVVAFDADVLGRRRTGDETYAANVLSALGGMDLPFRVLAYLRDPADLPAAASEWGVVTPVRVATASNHLRSAVALPARLRADRPALYHGNYLLPPALPCPGVVLVHDCSFLRHDGFMPAATQAAFRRFVPWSVRRAARVVTVSEFTRRDLLELRPNVAPERVVAIPNGVSAAFAPVDGAAAAVRARYGIDAPYVVFLGALQPRKNLRRLLAAWRIFKERRPESAAVLVLAGAPKSAGAGEEIDDLARRLGVAHSVRRLGYVDGQPALRTLLAGARALAYPSLYEGFGLPALEAMACGTPVLASNGTALPETVGSAAMLVDPASERSIADGLQRLVTDDVEHARLRRAGLRRAAELTWDSTAERLASVYLDCLSAGRTSPPRPAGLRVTKNPPVVTASVVSTGEAERLRPCIASLEAQALGERLRVVVVCNRPDDGSAQVVRTAFPRAAVVEQPTQRGFAENHNAGLAAASGDFGIILNPDVILRPGCIHALVELMDRQQRCGAAAPLLMYPDGRAQPSARRFPRPLGTLVRRTPLRALLPPATFTAAHYLAAPEVPRAIHWALGACLFVRRTAWDEVGGFDPVAFPRLYVEDIDLAWRMWQTGWEVWQTPDAVAVHEHQAATDKAFLQRRTLWHAEGMANFVRKHPVILAGYAPGAALALERAAGASVASEPAELDAVISASSR